MLVVDLDAFAYLHRDGTDDECKGADILVRVRDGVGREVVDHAILDAAGGSDCQHTLDATLLECVVASRPDTPACLNTSSS